MITRLNIRGFRGVERAALGYGHIAAIKADLGKDVFEALTFLRMAITTGGGDAHIYIDRAGGALRHPRLADSDDVTIEAIASDGGRFKASVDKECAIAIEAEGKGGLHEYRMPARQLRGQEENVKRARTVCGDMLVSALFCARVYDFSFGRYLGIQSDMHDNRRLHPEGKNLSSWIYLMQKTQPDTLKALNCEIRGVIPGVFQMESEEDEYGRLRLKYRERGYGPLFDAMGGLSESARRYIAVASLVIADGDMREPLYLLDKPFEGISEAGVKSLKALMYDRANSRDERSQIFFAAR